MIAPIAAFLASKWAVPTMMLAGGAAIQRLGTGAGAQTSADMLYQQGVQNAWGIEQTQNTNKGILGGEIANRNFIRQGNKQRQKLAQEFGMFEAGPVARERAKSAVDFQNRMNILESGPEATALRKQKNLENLLYETSLRADAANRKWGYVPSRNPFGFRGNV